MITMEEIRKQHARRAELIRELIAIQMGWEELRPGGKVSRIKAVEALIETLEELAQDYAYEETEAERNARLDPRNL